MFNEAVECFKFAAYRSAYIMSYLAFQTIIRNRILQDSKKKEYVDEDLLETLEDNDKWEGIISHIILREERGNPFKLSYNIRKKYDYWKVIRNECAHGSDITLGYAEIESFWGFIQQNIDKFTINGGAENIVNRIKKCFETRFEKKAYDVEDLEVIIEDTLRLGKEKDITELLCEINKTLNIKTLNIKTLKTDESKYIYKYWKGIVDSNDVIIYGYLVGFLKKDFKTFVYFVEVYPQLYIY